jgi:hypothetical protein
MGITVGILARDRLHNYAHWLAARPQRILVHYYHKAAVYPDTEIVPAVPTTWAHTVGAHFAIYRDYLRRFDSSHLLLASESCVPLMPLDKVSGTRLAHGVTYITQAPHMQGQQRVIVRGVNQVVRHEQWYIIAREHAALLLMHEQAITKAFYGIRGDNEYFVGTWLQHLGIACQVHNGCYTRWSPNSPHPDYFTDLGELHRLADGYITARKYRHHG